MEHIFYTDGGCIGNPGIGGWAFVHVIDNEIISYDNGYDNETTNNKMELRAVIEVLSCALSNDINTFTVYTDSQYVKNGITTWIHSWKAKNWKTANKSPVKNKELWQVLDTLASKCNINWQWVKGHSGNVFNEKCDSLVHQAIDKIK